jgi:AraC-like DNA-binding protein
MRLIAGRHYGGIDELVLPTRLVGDGSSLESVGVADCQGRLCRLDLLSLDVPNDVTEPRLLFRDLGTVASFVLFDAFFEFEQAPACPFSSRGGGIPLSELGSVVRLGDRRRFAQALDQLETGIHRSEDLDEARSMALTFLAVVAAALLELGAPKEVHRLQLNAARRFDQLEDRAAIVEAVRSMLSPVATSLVQSGAGPGDSLIDRALALVERNFARDLCDDEVARQLGLSTSHFRYLFRQATGKPFHQYVIQARMERARQMLLRDDVRVSEVARAVGYGSAAHFSRVFTRLYSVSPSAIRQARR